MELDQTPLLTLYTLEYPPQKGGVASYLNGLVHAFGGGLYVVHASDVVWNFWPRWLPLVGVMRRDHSKYGLLVSHVLPVGTAALFAKFCGGRSYSVMFHGLDLLSAERSRWKRWLVKTIVQHAYLLIVNSHTTADILARFTSRASLVLTPGIFPKRLLSKKDARVTLGVGLEEKVVLAVARLVPRKGIDVLIEAVHSLKTVARLVVIGQGPDQARLERLTPLLTHVTDQERDLWYAAADVFALPVREEKNDVEGFGIVFLEAAMAGLPVVAGQSGGVSEAVVDGVTGALVHPRDAVALAKAIDAFLKDPLRAEVFGNAGKRRVLESFRWHDRAAALKAAHPLVSIVIPVYNRIHLLEKTLRSLVRQTYQNFELIIIDDGSSQDVTSVVEKYKNKFSMHVERLPCNQGAPVARNRGFTLSRGEYVLFLDADVVLHWSALERYVSTLREHPRVDVVYASFRFSGKIFRGRAFEMDALHQGNYIHTSSMIRRGAFPGFDERLKKFQDWDLWLTMTARGSTMYFIDQTLFSVHGGGTMSAWLPRFAHRIPWELLGWMPTSLKRYRQAESLIKQKYGIE